MHIHSGKFNSEMLHKKDFNFKTRAKHTKESEIIVDKLFSFADMKTSARELK